MINEAQDPKKSSQTLKSIINKTHLEYFLIVFRRLDFQHFDKMFLDSQHFDKSNCSINMNG